MELHKIFIFNYIIMRKELERILEENPNTIRAEVAKEALDSEDPKSFFEELMNYGCQS